MSIYDEITTGDASIAVVYRLMDNTGRIWRSSPYVLSGCLYWNSGSSPGSSDYAADHRVRIPTLRHLMAGTQAQIELYVGNVDLQLFQVYVNDPTVNYIDVFPKQIQSGQQTGAFATIEEAVEYVGESTTLYTTGGALENGPPPIARCACTWNNRVFVANGNDVYPSQEFSEGLGVAWNSDLRSRWEDGTGEIVAMAPINADLLALFKRDAIGVISGPGPDGMGQGNFTVQMLNTEAGCTNVKSIVSGPDGVYYQDAQTGRLMVLTSSLQPEECAPGAFDYSTATITCALHVEKQRQLWLFARGASLSAHRLIVVDYKHRTEASPYGSVYTWWVPWDVAAMYNTLGGPVLVTDYGSTAAQVLGQNSDTIAGDSTPASIAMDMVTGDMNPISLQRQFNLCRVQFLGEYAAAHSVQVSAIPDFGARTTSTHLLSMSAGPEQMCARPANCMRIQAVRLRVREVINMTGTPPAPVINSGFKFVGFALEIQDCGKIANLSTTRIV